MREICLQARPQGKHTHSSLKDHTLSLSASTPSVSTAIQRHLPIEKVRDPHIPSVWCESAGGGDSLALHSCAHVRHWWWLIGECSASRCSDPNQWNVRAMRPPQYFLAVTFCVLTPPSVSALPKRLLIRAAVYQNPQALFRSTMPKYPSARFVTTSDSRPSGPEKQNIALDSSPDPWSSFVPQPD